MRTLLALALAAGLQAAHGQGSPLDQPLSGTDFVIYAPPGPLTNPSDASELGLLSRVSKVAGVPFGFESDAAAPRPVVPGTTVEAHLVAARTLRQALDAFVAMDPRYRWKDLDGVITVRTTAAWGDSADALNGPADDIHWHDLDPATAIGRFGRLLYPDLPRDYFDGVGYSRARLFSVDVAAGTVLDLLNAAVRSDGDLGWWVDYGDGATTKFELTIGPGGIGPTASWTKRPGAGAEGR